MLRPTGGSLQDLPVEEGKYILLCLNIGCCVPQECSLTGALKWRKTDGEVRISVGRTVEHQPWQPAMASTKEDLLFSLVSKSRPQLDESRLSGGVINKLPVKVRRGEVMASER